jgi:universal stress protein A
MNNLLQATPPIERGTKCRPIFRQIVVATDLSERSRETTAYALAIAQRFSATLTLVHVFEPEQITFTTPQVHEGYETGRRDAELTLSGLFEEVRRIHPECGMEFRVGEPVEQIAQMASTLNADLVVIGTHSHHLLPRLFAANEAPRILHAIHCPLLVYRAAAPAAETFPARKK